MRDPWTVRDHLEGRCSLADVLRAQPPREGLQKALERLQQTINEKEGGK
jgi:hypothetical protein